MKKYSGGNPVPKGVYLNLGSGEFYHAHNGACQLPGDSEERFIRVPGSLPVITAPIFGLGFVILLPLLGVLSFIGYLAYKAHIISAEAGMRILRPVLNDKK
ncbi:MAG: hypothetical protein Q8O43_03380 [Dehalococcoidia bacterium]|nr:hypothetical protein [Dehalococcoidia bacterium]